MEKQLEILKALLEGRAVYNSEGDSRLLCAIPFIKVNSGELRYVLNIKDLDQFTLTPQRKRLTFERIKKECVSGKHLLVAKSGNKRLYLGFNRAGEVVTDCVDGCEATTWSGHMIKNWTIEEYKGDE